MGCPQCWGDPDLRSSAPPPAEYQEAYGDKPVWFGYRRHHKGAVPPRHTRKACLVSGGGGTGRDWDDWEGLGGGWGTLRRTWGELGGDLGGIGGTWGTVGDTKGDLGGIGRDVGGTGGHWERTGGNWKGTGGHWEGTGGHWAGTGGNSWRFLLPAQGEAGGEPVPHLPGPPPLRGFSGEI